MPELPEVETIKSALAQSLGKCRIEDVIVNNHQLREKIPLTLKNDVIGSNIVKYYRRAKYIIIELDNGYSLIWHMGMSGKISITPNEKKSEKHDHVIIKTSKGFITYNDPRRFGLLTYTLTNNISKFRLFSKMGIEPFDNDFNELFLFNKLKNKKIPIKLALLDQSIVVGVGNIYASEALFGAKISPLRLANDVTLDECKKLVYSIKQVLKNAIAAGGSTLRDYEKPDGSLGYFQNQHCVYQKTGQRCPDCTCDIKKTGGIKKVVMAGRSTFFCPRKQV